MKEERSEDRQRESGRNRRDNVMGVYERLEEVVGTVKKRWQWLPNSNQIVYAICIEKYADLQLNGVFDSCPDDDARRSVWIAAAYNGMRNTARSYIRCARTELVYTRLKDRELERFGCDPFEQLIDQEDREWLRVVLRQLDAVEWQVVMMTLNRTPVATAAEMLMMSEATYFRRRNILLRKIEACRTHKPTRGGAPIAE